MELKQQFVMREVAGETLLIPVGKTSLSLNGMITLNEVGAEIWKMLPDVKNEEEIVARIGEEYDAEPEEIRADVRKFLNQIRELKIID